MFKHRVFLLIGLLLFPIYTALALEYTGKVVAITDGDTLTLLTADKRQIKVRLAEIDTPERRQPYGTRARQALSDLAFGKQARVNMIDRDRYGRVVGRVYADGVDINAELVRRGAAWVYRQYAHDPGLYMLEQEARREKRGLWALPEAQRMPPWEWRHAGKRPPIQKSPLPSAANTSSACGAKRYCRQMTSCEEAKFYLKHCGLSHLDGDGDFLSRAFFDSKRK